MKKISFVIPAYNEEKCIVGCINSIIESCFLVNFPRSKSNVAKQVSWEIIVVDNNSTDNTVKEIENNFGWLLKHPGFTIVHAYQQGLVYARNSGFQFSNNEWVAFIDADNRISPEWIETLLEEFTDDYVAISGPCVFEDMNKGFNKLSAFFYKVGNFSHKWLGPMLQGGNFVVKRSAMLEIGRFDTTAEFYGEDTLAAKDLAAIGNVKFCPDLKIQSSSRRLQNQGVLNTSFKYILNYLSVTLFNKSVSNTHNDFR